MKLQLAYCTNIGLQYSLTGLNYFKKVVPDLPWGSGLIYGGADRQTRSDTRIYPLSSTEEMLREIDK